MNDEEFLKRHDLSVVNIRYYMALPEDKTSAACYAHGSEHGSWGWSKQVDPRWNDRQVLSYLEGYVDGRIGHAAAGRGS